MHRLAPLVALLAALAPPAAAQAIDCGIFEAVEPDDTLARIARRCGVSQSRLADLNDHLDPRNLPMGGVVTIAPFEGRVRPEEIEGPSRDPILTAYRQAARGTWRGDGGSCGALAGSWTFDDRFVRGNATMFTLEAVYGTADRIVVDTVRSTDGEPFRLILRPRGSAMSVTGPGIATDLRRCPDAGAAAPAPRPAPPPPPPAAVPAPVLGGQLGAAYREAFQGLWRGLGESCRTVAGTWRFDRDAVTANGNGYRVRRLAGPPDAIRATMTRAATGETVEMVLVPLTSDRVTVSGPGFTTDLIRCR